MSGLEAMLAEIVEVRRSEEIPALLQRIATGYGTKTVAYLGTGIIDRRVPRHEPYIAVTYPPEWVERYRARGYLKIDPAIQIGLRRLLPIDWDEFDSGDHAFGMLLTPSAFGSWWVQRTPGLRLRQSGSRRPVGRVSCGRPKGTQYHSSPYRT